MKLNSLCLLLMTSLLLWGCASTPKTEDYEPNIDPYEGFNRAMYSFNNGLDIYFLKPIAKGYRFVAPGFVEKGVNNFFSNLSEVRNLLNAGLQGKGKKTLNHTGRFLINSTVGVLGLFDAAGAMGLDKTDGEDFGQTLGAWGAGSGSYIVLPLFGPSSVRDGIGLPVDTLVDPLTYVNETPVRNGLMFSRIVNTRAGLLDAEQLISGDRYIFIRDAYLQRREYLVNDGKLNFESDESSDSDDEDDFDF